MVGLKDKRLQGIDIPFMHNWIAAEYGYVAEEDKELSDEEDLIDYSEEDWEEAVEAYINHLDWQREQAAAISYEEEAELKWYIKSSDQKARFDNQISSVLELLTVQASREAEFSLLVMIHGHTVAAVEGYLASTFIHKVINSESLTRKLIETDPKFSKKSFTLKKIYIEQEKLKLTVAKYLKELLFHRIEKVNRMYKDVLSCDFGSNIGWLYKAVKTRHDCVHRAGLDHDGNKVEISIDSTRKLVHQSQSLVNLIESKINDNTEINELDK